MRRVLIGLTVLAAALSADVLFQEDFNSNWTTANPPSGWRIFYTPPEGTDDWHRKEPFSSPWLTRNSRYAAIFWNLYPGTPPDSLIISTIDCSGYGNVRLHVTTLFNRQLSSPYTAALAYSIDGGATFTVLRNYHDANVDSVPEVFDLPDARNQPNVVVAWIYDGNLANIKWWCIDDVRIEADPILSDDIACTDIVEPAGSILPGPLSPEAQFSNLGLNDQSNIPVACSLYDSGNNVLRVWRDTILFLASGDRVDITFDPPHVFASPEPDYRIVFFHEAADDENRANDTLARTFSVTFVRNLSYCAGAPGTHADWPVGHYGWGVRFNSPGPLPVYLESLKVYLDCPTNPNHRRYQLAVFEDNAGAPEKMLWKSPVLYGTDGWNSVFMADTGEQIVVPSGVFYIFYLQVGEPPEAPSLGVDPTLNNPGRYWQYRAGAFMTETPTGDLMIRASVNHEIIPPVNVDVRTVFVDAPLYDFVQRPFNRPIVPRARIENLGLLDNFSTVIVICSIFGPANELRYWDALAIDEFPAGSDTMVSFRPWTPERAGRCSVIVRNRVLALVEPDTIPQNDDKRFTVDVVKGAHSGESPGRYSWVDSDTLDGPVFAWVDTAGADVAIASGDEARIFVPIGFDFPYYDTTYNYVYVNTNGWLAFGPDQGTNESLPAPIPSTAAPNRALYPWWDNFAFGPTLGGGKVYFKNDGARPNRRFTVIWQDAWRVRADGDKSDLVSFQAALHENGSVTFQYKDVTTGDLTFDNGRYSAIGLENKFGTDGLCYLYDRPPLSASIAGLANRLAPGRAIRLAKVSRDAAALEITAPDHYTFPGEITPIAKIQNVGTVRDTIRVYLSIRPTAGPYNDSVIVTQLSPGDSTLVTFRPCTLALGTYTVVCSTAMLDDEAPANNVVSKIVVVSPWVQREDIGEGWGRRRIKSATLVYAPTTRRLYAMKGGNSNELWSYDPEAKTWDSLRSMPLDSSRRRAKDGCDLAFDPLHGNRGFLWAIKGGGQTDFYAYDIAADSWIHRAPVLITTWSFRAPKRGAAIVFNRHYGSEGAVYCIPGNSSLLFYRYDVALNKWEIPLDRFGQPVTVPRNPSSPFAACKFGSDMVFDGDSFVYVMRGSNTLDVYAYNPVANAWTDTLNAVSLLGPRNKRVKAGGSMALLSNTLFILKGGNTQEFWSYRNTHSAQDSWIRRSDIPISAFGRRRKVKRGSAMAGVDSTIFCLKGSYTNEFWEYKPRSDTVGNTVLGPRPDRSGIASGLGGAIVPELAAWPNPAGNNITVRFAVSAPGHARVRVYDRTGRVQRTLLDAPILPGPRTLRWNLLDNTGKRVASGVYILRLEAGSTVLTRKLIVSD